MITLNLNLSKPLKTLDESIKLYPIKIAKALRASVLSIVVPEIKANIRRQKNIFEGKLIQKVGVESVVSSAAGGKIAVDIGSIGVPYGLAVEQGQAPGTTQNLQKLIRYAKIKLGAKNPKLVGGLLKKAIEERGTIAYPSIVPAFKARRSDLVNDFIDRLSV